MGTDLGEECGLILDKNGTSLECQGVASLGKLLTCFLQDSVYGGSFIYLFLLIWWSDE